MDPDRMLHVNALRTYGGLGVPCRVPFQIYPYYIIIIIFINIIIHVSSVSKYPLYSCILCIHVSMYHKQSGDPTLGFFHDPFFILSYTNAVYSRFFLQ